MAAERRRTKIVATIGPVSSSHDVLRELVEAGVDAIRLNLSHGTQKDHASERGRRPRGAGGDRQAARADRRPPGPEAPHRRPRRARILLKDEEIVIVGEQHALNGALPIAPAVIGEVLRPVTTS